MTRDNENLMKNSLETKNVFPAQKNIYVKKVCITSILLSMFLG